MTNFDNKDYIQTAEEYRQLGEKVLVGLSGSFDALGTALNIAIPKQADILIVGGGGGREISALQTFSENWTFSIVDPSEKMLALAEYWAEKENLKERTKFLKGYIHEFDFTFHSFDAITCFNVLHYLDRDERVKLLEQVRKSLKPNGVFVYSLAVKPETLLEQKFLIEMYRRFPLENGLDTVVVNKVMETLEKEYKMMTRDEEETLLKRVGLGKRIEIFSTLFFKTYISWKD